MVALSPEVELPVPTRRRPTIVLRPVEWGPGTTPAQRCQYHSSQATFRGGRTDCTAGAQSLPQSGIFRSVPFGLGWWCAAAIASSRVRSSLLTTGRPTWRRNATFSRRSMMISRSLKCPERTSAEASLSGGTGSNSTRPTDEHKKHNNRLLVVVVGFGIYGCRYAWHPKRPRSPASGG